MINPFKDPEVWAQRSVGSRSSFAASVVLTIALGVGIIHVISKVACEDSPLLWTLYSITAFATVGAPLIALTVLRLLLLKTRAREGTEKGSGPKEDESSDA